MWKDDGTGFMTGKGNILVCSASTSGSQSFNALWCIDPTAKDLGGVTAFGEYCWAFELLEGEVKVGLTSAEAFQKGWLCRGFFYGGNVSDGGALLTQNFGPRPKVGSVVKLVLSLSEEKLEIGVLVDGKRLGIMFSLDAPYPVGLLPVVSFASLTGRLSINEVPEIPLNFRVRQNEENVGVEGLWSPVKDSVLYHESEPTLTVKLKNNGLQADIWTYVVNRGHFTLKKIDNDLWHCDSKGMMTRMAGPPAMMSIEQAFIETVCKTEQLFVDSSGQLHLSGSSTQDVLLRRYQNIPPICTVNPLVRG